MEKEPLSDNPGSRWLFSARNLLWLTAAMLLLSFIGTRSQNTSTVIFFDNLHWTVSTLAAAALAWLGVRQGSGNERLARYWFFLALSAFAFGQILWDIQVSVGWNPFPGPSDLFYLMLGTGCIIGLTKALKGQLSIADKRAMVLDTAMLVIPILALSLELYLPQSANFTPLRFIVFAAYPVLLLTASCVAALTMLHLRQQLTWPSVTFLAGLIAEGLIWMHWNELVLKNETENGSLYNMSFSVITPLLGLAAMKWRIAPSGNQKYRQRCENILRMLPLFGVVFASVAVILVMTWEVLPVVRLAILLAASVVLAIAFLRQSLLLSDRERVLKAEQAVRENERKLQNILDNISANIYLKDTRGRYLYANKQVCDLWHTSLEKIIGTDDDDFYDAETAARLRQNDRRVLMDGETIKVEETATAGINGQTAIYWSTKLPLRNDDGSIYALLGVSTDITERKQAEDKLQLSARVFAEAHEGISITDATGKIIDTNPTFTEITGYSREEVIGKNLRFLKSGKQPPDFYADMWQAISEDGHWQGEIWNRKKSGAIFAQLLTISALRDEKGEIKYYVGLFTDITQIKQQQQSLELMAHYDGLTQLPNRVLFADRFNQSIARARRDKLMLAICYIDLDGFKQVNDSLGHDAGDALLIEVAVRIKGVLREEDTVSRLGGDEFALLLGDMESLDQCEQTLARIHQAIALPYTIDDQDVIIGASSGVTLYPQDDADPDTLLRHADQAMCDSI